MDEWRPVKNYEGLYEVSNHGKVRSVRREFLDSSGHHKVVPEVILKEDERHAVNLCKDQRYKSFMVRSLVAESFLGLPYGTSVSHIDRDISNASLSNLMSTDIFRNLDPDWRDIPGWEGYYQASRFGQIRSVDRCVQTRSGNWRYCPGVVRILDPDDNGYFQVALYRSNENPITTNVQRFIAQAWIPNPENKPTVNHIDGDKHNNCIENLEWATYSEQQAHALRMGLRQKSYWDCAIHGPVGGSWNEDRQIRVRCIETGLEYESMSAAGEAIGASASEIKLSVDQHRICNGLHFVRANEPDYEFGVKSLEGEIWRDVPGWEGLYQFSNKDRLKSVQRVVNAGKGRRTVPEKILKVKDSFSMSNKNIAKVMSRSALRELVFPEVYCSRPTKPKKLFNID